MSHYSSSILPSLSLLDCYLNHLHVLFHYLYKCLLVSSSSYISPNSFIQQIHSLGTFSNHLNLYSLKANFSTIWRPSDLLIIITPGEILSIILLPLLSYNSSFSTLLLLYFNKTFLTPHFHPFHPACILFSNSFCALSISLQGWPSVQMFPKLNTDYGSQSSTCWSP